MISTTPTVICSVINKQHWSHKCGCQYIHYNSAAYTHHHGGGRSNGPYADSLPLSDHFQGGGGGGGLPRKGGGLGLGGGEGGLPRGGGLGGGCQERGGMGLGGGKGGCQERGGGQASYPDEYGIRRPPHHYITTAFSGIPKYMGGAWGTKSELVGPTIGRKCYKIPAFSGIPKERGTKSELDA